MPGTSNLCGTCKVSVRGKKSLLCVYCLKWFHTDCESVTKEAFQFYDKNRRAKFTCHSCEGEGDPADPDVLFKQEMRKEFAEFSDEIKSLRHINKDIKTEQTKLKDSFEVMLADIRKDLNSNVDKLNGEVQSCKEIVARNEENTSEKIYQLQLENNVLQHQANRNDIIISGLPDALDDLKQPILDLCNYFKIKVDKDELLQVFYVRRHKAILVKFKTASIRDEIMKCYFKEKNLKLSDIIDIEISSRIYLNDNLAPMAVKLRHFCQVLVKEKKISSFKFLNRANPRCNVKMLNGDLKMLDLQQCYKLFGAQT